MFYRTVSYISDNKMKIEVWFGSSPLSGFILIKNGSEQTRLNRDNPLVRQSTELSCCAILRTEIYAFADNSDIYCRISSGRFSLALVLKNLRRCNSTEPFMGFWRIWTLNTLVIHRSMTITLAPIGFVGFLLLIQFSYNQTRNLVCRRIQTHIRTAQTCLEFCMCMSNYLFRKEETKLWLKNYMSTEKVVAQKLYVHRLCPS